jgi:hypothetical protein
MARHRTLVRLSRALRALAVIVATAAGTTALFQADLGRGLVMPSWKVATAPPVLYLTIALVAMRYLPLDRKLGWVLAACGVNLALGLASAVTLSLSYPMSLEGALARALWTYVPAPIIHLVAAPLVLLAWRSRVVPGRVTMRRQRDERVASAAAVLVPGPPLATATPNWDAVLRPSSLPAWAAGPGPAPFERVPEIESRGPERPTVAVLEIPDEAVDPTAAAPASASPPRLSVPPPVAPAAPTAPPPPTATIDPPAAPDEPVVRVPLLKVAAQLPPDVFTLPPERLAESLREPHVLVVPRRLVVPQLGEGAVEIAWTLIEDQFPELALAVPAAEVRRRFPEWVISLPMDEVVRQIPAELLRVEAPAADLSDIGAFPAPFTPGPPAPEPAPTPPAPQVAAAALETPAPPPPPVVAAASAAPAQPPPPPPVVTASAVPPPPPAPPPVVTASVAPAPPPPPAVTTSGPPTPMPPPAAPVREPAPVVQVPAVATRAAAEVEEVDEEAEALARTLALGLTSLGAFDWHTRRVGGRPLVSFVPPVLAREAIDTLATAATALVARLTPWAVEQVTIRTSRLACVLTPLGTRGCLAATVRRNGAVAMLELVSARAARGAGVVPAVAAAGGAVTAVATAPARAGNGHRRLEEAARALAPFGPVGAAVAEPDGGAPGVYVFAGRDGGVLAGVARLVHEALVAGHDGEALGRLETIELRRGRERVVVRPLRGQPGAPAILAAAGEVALAGRAHRAIARAAALLEAR